MRDACTITRVSVDPASTDPDTGVQSPTTQAIYTGPCRVQLHPAVARIDNVGEASVWQLPVQLQLPMATSAGVAVEDTVTVTASVDADLVGRVFWVRALFHATDKTARRLGLEEVT